MLSKFFKKNAPPAPAASSPRNAAVAARTESEKLADREADKAAWAGRLQSSLGDDKALLALAREAPFVDIKHDAVSALAGEEALRLAEREFRSGNQRVHRAAKQRYQALVAQRESREQASRLIESAAVLLHETTVPANRLVELDRAWRALDASLLTEQQNAEYARLADQLATQLRERGEQRLALNRWVARAEAAAGQLDATSKAVEAGTQAASELAAAVEAAQAALAEKPSAAPGADEGASLAAALQAALQNAAEVPARLAAQEEARRNAPPPPPPKEPKASEAKPAKAVPSPALPGLVEAAEAALAGGHLAEARTHLVAIDAALGNGAKTPLQPRIDALQAEFARLRGWQHWGGGRVRDDLVDEAEALARRVAEVEQKGGKLPVRQHAESIEGLRERWKELDRLGAAGGKALWQRFDTALKAAYVPVAAEQARLKAARQENLEARRRLLAGLDALSVDGEAVDWRAVARALEQCESEWRKLGPVEHTVPHKARDALLAQRAASIARLEAPLDAARRVARTEREKLIERARAVSADARSRDAVGKVRDLQAEWQQHAKGLPLARNVENALWAEFKAATDALFKQRDAESSARDAELKAHQAAREALIARLGELNDATPPEQVERTVAAVDREWRSAGEAPRSEAGRLEEKFRAARAAALQLVADRKQRAWQATCDALRAKLALCEALEAKGATAAGDAAAADGEAGWPAEPALPPAWEQVLQARFKAGLARQAGSVAAGEVAADKSFDALLLQIESALDIASPPAFQAARRDLKLRAMKDALEGRQQPAAGRPDVEPLLVDALARTPADETQRQRLQTIIDAIRTTPPAPVAPRDKRHQ